MLSVILPTHNPHTGRLQRTLDGLRSQNLPPHQWEVVLIDNASDPAVGTDVLSRLGPVEARIVMEPQLGLSHARRRGLAGARGDFIVMVDDDNVLAPAYLAQVLQLFAANPRVGALGGRSHPEFEYEPEAWVREFDDLLACRDLGSQPLVSAGLHPPGTNRAVYPAFAPIGAGMALRREAAQAWLSESGAGAPSDRRGGELTSGGDNDIVLSIMKAGWEVGYFPELVLTHLIPSGRTTPDYLARLNRGIAKSWVQVLHRHAACPWAPIPGWSVPLRQTKSWLKHRAWTSPAARVRWQGACGHFEGLASLKLT